MIGMTLPSVGSVFAGVVGPRVGQESSVTKLILMDLDVPSFAGLFRSKILDDPSLTCFNIKATNLPTPRSIKRD